VKRWLLAAACGVAALGLMLYPLIGELVSEKYHSDVETTYTAAIEDTDDTELTAQRQAAEQYNAMLSGTAAITEGEASASPLPYAEQLTVGGVMCYIDIPKINVYLPVQHGTGAETLEKSVGHVVGTSLPVGGSSTHAVLSAHSGMAASKLFSDIDQLTEGDVFYIHVLGDTLAYEVDSIHTVLPTDTSLLQIEEGKDYVTLVTCTPFGVNTHRLLVRGHRAPYVPEQEEPAAAEKPVASSWTQHYLIGLGIGLGVVAVIGGAYFLVRRVRHAYKDFSDPQLDTIEIMLSALYKKWDISEETDFRRLMPEDYPILSDLYALINNELVNYRNGSLYTRELLQEVLLGLHSLCVGADAPFFNGHTNISDDRFLVFGVGGVLTAAKSLRNALLFNVLAYMSDRLLTAGNTVAALDELYLWLSNPVAIEYIRNCLKRVRKRDSALMMASQNLEDFDQEGVREMTKPLFAIPPHQFLFNPGSIGKRFYMDMLQLDEAEFELIRRARRGECLFKCGAERYHLEVKAPPHKAALFGTKGGK